MRNDRVLIRALHVAHDTKCFLPCVHSYFHRHTIGQIYFITKMPTFGLCEYKVEGLDCGFNQKRGLNETDS